MSNMDWTKECLIPLLCGQTTVADRLSESSMEILSISGLSW